MKNEKYEIKVKKAFGEELRLLRKKKSAQKTSGLSQESLALACDLDRTYIGGVERGERNISLVNIQKIAKTLGIPAKDFFNE